MSIIDRELLILAVFITAQVVCGLKSEEKEDEYVSEKVNQNREALARNMFETRRLDQISKKLELTPLEVDDLVPKRKAAGHSRPALRDKERELSTGLAFPARKTATNGRKSRRNVHAARPNSSAADDDDDDDDEKSPEE